MKKFTFKRIFSFVIGVLFIIGFYYFGFYAYCDGSLGEYIVLGLVFFVLGHSRFYNVPSLYKNDDEEMPPFMLGLLITELYFSFLRHLSNEFLYVVIVSYILGVILTRFTFNKIESKKE